jgi:hypothetical protein
LGLSIKGESWVTRGARYLEGIQKRALEEGITYQTLIATVLLKYLSGRLVDRREQP